MVSEGNLYAKVGYDLPVGFDGIRLGGSLSFLNYSLGEEFEDLDAEGSASNLSFTASYPVIRQVRQNLRLSGGLFVKNYENEQLGVQTSDKAVTAINVGVSGDQVDAFQGGGVFYYGVSLTLGDLDLSGNQINLAIDDASARTNGTYSKIDWNVARLQKINEETNLWLSASGQFSDKNLDSSETMSLGGANGVRAYPALEASGDEGIILTTELRYRFRPNWTVKGFIDAGQITQKSTAVDPSEKHTLKGFGVGVDWNNAKQMITARLNISTRIGDNPLRDPVTGDDSDGSSNDYPVWLNITKHF
jgi:hemolysin activation/secretion protein